MSGIVFYAEAKMGKLLSDIDRAKGRRSKKTMDTGVHSLTELQKVGVSMRERSRAQILGRNKDAIEEVI